MKMNIEIMDYNAISYHFSATHCHWLFIYL